MLNIQNIQTSIEDAEWDNFLEAEFAPTPRLLSELPPVVATVKVAPLTMFDGSQAIAYDAPADALSPIAEPVATATTEVVKGETENPMLASALTYARRGWHVIPLHTPVNGGCSCFKGKACGKNIGKHPRTVDGLKASTTDPVTIREWWSRWPDANVGIVCGGLSKLIVVDVDADKGGPDSLDLIVKDHGALPLTVEALTGGGGRHLLFNYPKGEVIGNRVGMRPGIDIRASGGYIVAPPSLHRSGWRYEWEASSTPDEVGVVDCPRWLLAMVKGNPAAEVPTVEDKPASPTAVPSDGERAKAKAHVKQRAMAYLDADRPAAIEGNGGDGHTFKLAGHLLSLACLGERLTAEEVVNLMGGDWNSRCSPPWDISELRGKVESAATNGTARTVKRCEMCDGADLDLTDWSGTNAKPSNFKPSRKYGMDDVGNGELFADAYADELRYISEWKRWAYWDGKRWAVDAREAVRVRAHDLLRHVMPLVAKGIGDDDRRAKYFKHIAASHASGRIDNMVREASAIMALSVKDLDRDPWLFNCQNGTLDCRTGTLRPHDRKDLNTKISPCSFDPTATAPTWEKFLGRIFQDASGQTRTDLVSFVQRMGGYALTASVKEQCLFVLYGSGANGKSTFINALLYAMGDYGQQAQSSLLMSSGRGGNGNGEDVARLFGVRAVMAIETREGKSFDEEKVKSLTGGDRITARYLFQNSFEFEPTHKILLATNHRPTIKGTDWGIWRRLNLIPFDATIADAEKDADLVDKLKSEGDGILAWLVAGLNAWRTMGLQAPSIVKDRVTEYRAESDLFGMFLAECCVAEKSASVTPGILYRAYQAWAERNGVDFQMTAITMGKKLKERGFEDVRRNSGRLWLGIDLADANGKDKADASVF